MSGMPFPSHCLLLVGVRASPDNFFGVILPPGHYPTA
jgi:hypothetical protein